MLLVYAPEDLQHGALVPAGQVLRVVGPGHVEAARAAVHRQEGRGLVVHDKPPEDARLGLAERAWARVHIAVGALLVPLDVPISVEVDAVGVCALAEAPALDRQPGPGVPVEHELELAVLQCGCCGPRAVAVCLSAQHPQQVQAALGADQFTAVFTEDDEDAVGGAAAGSPHPGHVDGHAGVVHGPEAHRAAAVAGQAHGLSLQLARGVVPGVHVLQGSATADVHVHGRRHIGDGRDVCHEPALEQVASVHLCELVELANFSKCHMERGGEEWNDASDRSHGR
mmetsp:Transcript_111894/g.361249  ORF Transcript_111894/g.361249 Transcript_111894/m.361249 type:complete len:283 (+) Transcript_111894:561-1409(+)